MAGSIRILVVDDNHVIRRLVALVLEGAGYVPFEADSGEAALEVVHEVVPDLCIVDEVMPGMTGSELIAVLRRAGDPRVAQLPVVAMSARAEGVRALLRAGASAFLSKPIDEDALLATVASVLGDRARAAASAQPEA